MKNFDEKIRDKLFDAEMPVASGVWDSIEKNLERKDKRPFIWLMLMMLLTGLPALYFGVYYDGAVAQSVHSEIPGINADQQADRTKLLFEKRLVASLLPLPFLFENSSNQVQNFSVYKRKSFGFQLASPNKSRSRSQFSESAANEMQGGMSSLQALGSSEQVRLAFEDRTFDQKTEALFRTKTECPRFRQRWPVLYAYGSAHLSMPFQSLGQNTAESAEWLELREATEFALPGFGFQAGLGYDFYDGLFIQAGIAYNQVNLKFQHFEEDVISNRTSIITDTLFSGNGEILSITRDTVVTQEIGTTETVARNTFRMIDIPFEVGYHYPVSQRFNIRASVGLAFNIQTQSSGMIVDSNDMPFQFGQNDSNFYKTKLGLSYLANLVLETRLNDKMYLNAGLRMRHFATDFNTESNPVREKFTNLGLTAGIRYRI